MSLAKGRACRAKTSIRPSSVPPRTGSLASSEYRLTRLIEQLTAKIPSVVFLVASLGAMATSLVFEVRRNQRASRFIGMWVAPLLVMGVYNKLLKVLGPS